MYLTLKDNHDMSQLNVCSSMGYTYMYLTNMKFLSVLVQKLLEPFNLYSMLP